MGPGIQTRASEEEKGQHEKRDQGQALTSEVVATNIEDLGALSERPDLGLLQVLKVIVVRGAQGGAHRPVVAGDDNTAATGRHLLVDAVLNPQADGADGILEDSGVLVVADAADVDDAVGGQDVRGTAGGVLGSATSDELRLVVGQEVLIDGHVRVLGEDGIVGLELVLGQELVIANSLDVCGASLVSIVGSTKKKGDLTWCSSDVRTLDSPLFKELSKVGLGKRVQLHTEERVPQTEEGVILGRGHFAARLAWF